MKHQSGDKDDTPVSNVSHNLESETSSTPSRRRITRKDTWVAIHEQVDEWEVQRRERLEQRQKEAAERKRLLEEELRLEQEERRKEREKKRLEREAQRKADEDEARKRAEDRRERLRREREKRRAVWESSETTTVVTKKEDKVVETKIECAESVEILNNNVTRRKRSTSIEQKTTIGENQIVETSETSTTQERYKDSSTTVSNKKEVLKRTFSKDNVSIEITEIVSRQEKTLEDISANHIVPLNNRSQEVSLSSTPPERPSTPTRSGTPTKGRHNFFINQRNNQLLDPCKDRLIYWTSAPESKVLEKKDLFVIPNRKRKNLKLPDNEFLLNHFLQEGRVSKECATEILRFGTQILKKEPNVLKLSAPFFVVGDIHGQFYDLTNIFKESGEPSKKNRYLFLGDYVDRGMFSCEVFLFLLSLKISRKRYIYLLRGNHETRDMSSYHNFQLEVKKKYGDDMIELFMNAFDALPLAATITSKGQGSFFCCHGGLSPSIKTLDDILKIDRFIEPPDEGPLCDLIWSDPVQDENYFNQNYSRNKDRSCSYVYGYNPIIDFLDTNDLFCIVRAHQVEETGYREIYFSQAPPERKAHPLVITVFSAPNYCDKYENMGAYLEIDENEYNYHQFSWREHPYVLPDFVNGFDFSISYAIENIVKVTMNILEMIQSQEDDEDDKDESLLTDKVKNLSKAFVVSQKMRKDQMSKIADIIEKSKSSQQIVDIETREVMNKVQRQRGLKRAESDILSLVRSENRRFAQAKIQDKANEAKPNPKSNRWKSQFRKLQRNMTFKI